MTHELKIGPASFHEVRCRAFAILREGDCPFSAGDVLRFREWSPRTEQYTGYEVQRAVVHVLRNTSGLYDGYCVLGFSCEFRESRP